MFLSSNVERKIRGLRKVMENNGISEELRGYRWDTPPVEPINDLKISVSDINSFCETRRDIYIKYILRERGEINSYMLRGLAYHRVIKDTISSLKRAVYSGCGSGEEIIEEFFNSQIPLKISEKFSVDEKEIVKLYRYLIIQIAARVDEALSKYPELDAENIVALAIPPFTERRADGSAVGLSQNLSVDLFMPNIVMDFKSGYERNEHAVSLAGYALAIEADDEIDVNYGFVVYIRVDRNVCLNLRAFLIDDELRREFLEARDEIAGLLESGLDPGKPAECPRYCMYYCICNESCD